MPERKPTPNRDESTSRGPATGDSPTGAADDEITRPRGRPRTEIDPDAVADAVAALFMEGGMKAVSIVSAAQKLDVSRATLYRAVPTREHLLGTLFERSTRELTELASEAIDAELPVAERLRRMVELQVDAAVRMRHYLSVFFDGPDLPTDVVDRWHLWSRQYEEMWAQCVEEAMDQGVLTRSNVVATTRLILGMCIWVSRWYRPGEGIESATIAAAANAMLFPHD
jgi:AcrR family transcriptional regulator